MQFSVRIELYGKCMTSIFPYMEIVWLVFLVILGIQYLDGFLVISEFYFSLFVWIVNSTFYKSARHVIDDQTKHVILFLQIDKAFYFRNLRAGLF